MMMMNGGNTTMGMPRRKKMMMHMTFYWGKDALILFTGWPGVDNTGMYVLALFFVFFLAIIVEWLAHCNAVMMKSNGVASTLAQTLVYTIRVGLGFMVMLALMSFNFGVFLTAVLGHALGFFFFRVIMRSSEHQDVVSTAC
uniref:copper transporter 1-like n=1 Tax=Erigeron canadensis TaxID=72917 RepID=UPI001CB94B3E|nr:copper transporter 1-like [Erigeron canadensis]